MVRGRTAMRTRFFFYSTNSSFTFRVLRMVITSLCIREDCVQKYATCQYDWISPVHPSRVRSYCPHTTGPTGHLPDRVKAPFPTYDSNRRLYITSLRIERVKIEKRVDVPPNGRSLFLFPRISEVTIPNPLSPGTRGPIKREENSDGRM